MNRLSLVLLSLPLIAGACGDSGFDSSSPFGPSQGGGGSPLIRTNAAVLVDPAGHHAWVRRDDSLYAVSTTSAGAPSIAYPLDGLSDIRLAFLPGDLALLVADDPLGCPFATTACTRVASIDTGTVVSDVPVWEGSTLEFATQSPLGHFVALSGGFASSGVFVAGAEGDLRPMQWEALLGGVGWSRCLEDAGCDERLWMVGKHGIRSWPAVGGVLATDPDIVIDADCKDRGPYGYLDMDPLVAASADGRWVALTCDRTFSLFDTLAGTLRDTPFHGPVTFTAAGTIVGHDREDDDDSYYSFERACIQLILPMTLAESLACLPTSESFGYYVTEDDHVVASNSDGIFVMEVDGLSSYAIYVPSDLSLEDGRFVERLGHQEVWFANEGSLYRLDYGTGAIDSPFPLPFAAEHFTIFPSQDRLAMVSSGSVVFVSLVTGSAEQVALP